MKTTSLLLVITLSGALFLFPASSAEDVKPAVDPPVTTAAPSTPVPAAAVIKPTETPIATPVASSVALPAKANDEPPAADAKPALPKFLPPFLDKFLPVKNIEKQDNGLSFQVINSKVSIEKINPLGSASDAKGKSPLSSLPVPAELPRANPASIPSIPIIPAIPASIPSTPSANPSIPGIPAIPVIPTNIFG